MSESVDFLRQIASTFLTGTGATVRLLVIADEFEAAQARLPVLETEHREFYERATKAEAELERVKMALRDIVSAMGPHALSCRGCEDQWNNALIIARLVLQPNQSNEEAK